MIVKSIFVNVNDDGQQTIVKLRFLYNFLHNYIILYNFYQNRWFNKHLKEFGDWKTDEERVSIVLLTNDHGNKIKARDEGIEVYTGMGFFFT